MRAVFTVEVPDEFLVQRAAEFDGMNGCVCPGPDTCAGPPCASVYTNPAEFFQGRCEDIAEDELPVAFFGWPVEITVELAASDSTPVSP